MLEELRRCSRMRPLTHVLTIFFPKSLAKFSFYITFEPAYNLIYCLNTQRNHSFEI